MRRSFRHLAALLLCIIFSIVAISQNITVSGNVRNSSNKEVVPSVSIILKGTTTGTFTDERGNFRLTTNKQPPFTLVITSVGFEPQEIIVNDATTPVQVDFVPGSSLEIGVVVAASRIPERILAAPVSIERIGLANIRNTPATNYYDILRSLKGVDLTTSSLTFNTVSTRGFNGSGNARLNQLVDGMDNQAPGLNFAVGSVIGLTELDVESMELLPGASSALYGPGGMNGTLLINSKNPFRYQGLSVQIKTGIMHVDKKQRGSPAPYYDWSLRWGHKVSDNFAFKIGAQFIHAKDWVATDYSNYKREGTGGKIIAGTRDTDKNFDGVNIYGDETSVDIRPFLMAAKAANPALAPCVDPLLPTAQNVSRTGYLEREVVNNNTLNFRFSGGLYYNVSDNTELSLLGYVGTGNTVYTGSDRYSLKDLKMAQYKLELKNPNWFVRAYTTQENAGETYNSTVTTRLFNELWKPSYNPASPATSWYPQYTGAFLQACAAGVDQFNAHKIARNFADVGRPAAGSSQFTTLFDRVRKIPISKGGGLFLDKTDLYQVEGQYNFTKFTNIAEVIVGGNYRRYNLNSEGTLFADTTGPIGINEFGAYAQVAKSLFNDLIKLTAAGRYDKNENFKGRFTPRVTAVVKVATDHHIRASYQTAYRFPSNQNQWINLLVSGGVRLLGGLPTFRDHYKFNTNPVYTQESFLAFAASGNPALLEVQQFGEYKPESVTSYEVGYKGLVNKRLLFDVYGYMAKYKDFLGRIVVFQSKDGTPAGLATPNIYSVAVNSTTEVDTRGFGIGIDYLLRGNFAISVNYSSDVIRNVPTNFVAAFNTPENRVNAGLSNSGFGYQKRLGFNVMLRWQDEMFYESDFSQGLVEEFTTVDAQISFKFPKQRSLIKIGATNLLNKYYKTAIGNPEVGGIYYVSFGYNVL